MNIETVRQYCLAKPGCTESFPFDNDTLVFKVLGKMFALVSIQAPDTINLKCDPEYALELRETHPEEVFAGYHMSKKHWNTVSFVGRLGDGLIRSLIDHSYDLVVSKLPKRDQATLAEE
jgi:predicted DNA-binding protein (MmcQ/YjbR family)